MLGASDKTFPLKLWWERGNQEHEELPLLSSDEAMQPELNFGDTALQEEEEEAQLTLEKVESMRKVALMALMGLIVKLEPELKLMDKLLRTEPEPDLKLLLTETDPNLKLKEKLLLKETEPEPEFISKKRSLLPKPLPTLEKALQVEPVTDTDTDTETEPQLALDQNALLALDTDTETMSESESDTETGLELTVEEMLELVEPDAQLTMEEKVLQGLHLTFCKEFTEYDPRKNSFVCTRFCSFNIAFFDLDEECEYSLTISLILFSYSFL
jgi:hypothetical protein